MIRTSQARRHRMELTCRGLVTSQWGPMMYNGRRKVNASYELGSPADSVYEPGPPGESVEQFFTRVRSKFDEKYSSLFDSPMSNETSVLNCDHDSNRSLSPESRSPSLDSLLDDESLPDLAQSPCQAVYTQYPLTQTYEDHLTCLTENVAKMNLEDRRAYALQVASGHPDAMPPASRSAQSKANRSTHRTLSKYVADLCKPALSWCKGRSYAQGGIRSQVSKDLGAGTKRSHIFGRTLSRAGSHIKNIWNSNRRRYLGINLKDRRHPWRRGKEHRERANRGYSDISRTTSTNAHPQTTRRSSPRPSNPGVGRPLPDHNFSGTDALSLHSDSQLPDDPRDMRLSLSPSDYDPLDLYKCDISTDTVGWPAATYFSTQEGQSVFGDADASC